ncbi:MAG: tRNA dimethylallyltransferase [Verrucomicrobia bacterium]|nr:MAG: tRNA dimethylallyltransferase [Verrucomicrobiota bacterium]
MDPKEIAPAPALVIGGPTASGKSTLALELAQKTGAEIINADAFQLYRGLPLLTAQPSPQELALAPHQLVGEFDLAELFDAARYMRLARERIAQSWAAGRPPILVGGTGLYIRSVLYGLSEGLPSPDAALRLDLETRPIADLCRQLVSLDGEAAHTVDLQNPRRVIRALEVCLLTGRPFTSFREPKRLERPLVGVWLSVDRALLHHKIETRAGQLFQNGVEEEVRLALPRVGSNSKQAIGLQDVRDVLEGKASRETAVERIVFATRQYARRQETWFRKETALKALSPEHSLKFCLGLLENRRP